MSYILEALKKSEQQREIGRVPTIKSVHERTPKSVSKKWLWLIVSVLMLNAGLLLLSLWPEGEPDKLSGSGGPVQALEEGDATAGAASQPAPLHSQAAPPVAEPARPAPVAGPPAVAAIEAEAVLSSATKEPPLAAAPPSVPPRVEPPPAPVPVVKVEAPALPVWPQIPSHLLQQLNGSLRLDVHVFSDQPQERFVMINMQKYREDEKLQEGPLLDEITPEGVILSFRGQRFRLQAQ